MFKSNIEVSDKDHSNGDVHDNRMQMKAESPFVWLTGSPKRTFSLRPRSTPLHRLFVNFIRTVMEKSLVKNWLHFQRDKQKGGKGEEARFENVN